MTTCQECNTPIEMLCESCSWEKYEKENHLFQRHDVPMLAQKTVAELRSMVKEQTTCKYSSRLNKCALISQLLSFSPKSQSFYRPGIVIRDISPEALKLYSKLFKP